MPVDESRYEYVGFWARAWASLVDTVLLGMIVWPLLTIIYGTQYWAEYFAPLTVALGGSLDALARSPERGPADVLISWVLPAVAIVAFWIARQATPGKMLIHAKIVDADTAAPLTRRQAIVRYLGYYVSLLGLGLGFFRVGWDRRKQGWHDKLAGTVVIRARRGN
jgi:uncharacterized RDD family membrane protein YckC